MKEKILKILDRYNDFCNKNEFMAGEIVNIIDAEVEKRIKERMPSEEEMNNEANTYGELAKDNTPDYGVEENASLDFLRGASWLRSRLTKPGADGSQKTEQQMWRDITTKDREK